MVDCKRLFTKILTNSQASWVRDFQSKKVAIYKIGQLYSHMIRSWAIKVVKVCSVKYIDSGTVKAQCALNAKMQLLAQNT